MTSEEYFEKHIPHRLNLLLTFRERFSQMPNNCRENFRDIFRCSKDISILMVRFLLGELGLRLGEGDTSITNYNNKKWKDRIDNFKIKPLLVNELEKDLFLYNDILIVLMAANRAVAHIDAKDVDHPITDKLSEKSLLNAIDYTEDKIKSHMYHSKNEYEKIMNDNNNNMHRYRFVLHTCI